MTLFGESKSRRTAVRAGLLNNALTIFINRCYLVKKKFFNFTSFTNPNLVRSQTIRLGILISTLIITAIITFQLVWLRQVYNFEQREFDHRITRAIKGNHEDVHSVQETFWCVNNHDV